MNTKKEINKNLTVELSKGEDLKISLIGELDMNNSILFKEYVILFNNKNEYEIFYLNLEKLTYIDSSGIGILASLNEELLALNKKMILLSPSTITFNAIKFTKLEQYFQIEKQK